jgi:hypothetical protein
MNRLMLRLIDGDAVPIVRAPWKRGAEPHRSTDVVVSFTEFTFDRYRDLPHILVASSRLRYGWRRREGAVGISSYARLASRRIGTISVWSGGAALHTFVASPYHARIMRRYRSRGTIRATTWTAAQFNLNDAYREAHRLMEEARRQLPNR